MSRKVAREVAMKLAFARLFGCDDTYAEVLEKSGIKDVPSESDIEFAEALLQGINEKSEEIDALINEISYEWSAERM